MGSKLLYNRCLRVFAAVAELADALHSGCSARQGVEVRVLSAAPVVCRIEKIFQSALPR